MTDFLLPPDLGIAAATPNLDANTASFKSPTVGSTRSVERLGDALRFQFNFTTVNDDPAMKRQRGRLQAFLSSLRGQSGRVWMTPPGALLRGSFPATEMFTNNDFSNGTTGWSTDAEYTIAAIDRGIRATRARVTASSYPIAQTIARSTGIPYCIRGFISAGKGSASICLADNSNSSQSASITQGMLETAYTVGVAGSGTVGIADLEGAVGLASNYFDAKWSSLSRCALVDNGVNLLLNSDVITNATTGWAGTATGSTQTNPSGSAAAPDGTVTATNFSEDGTTGAHRISQNVTVAAAAADFTFSIFVNNSNRAWSAIGVQENTGVTAAIVWFNVSTGAIGTQSAGTNVAIIASQVVNYGNGWKRLILTVRKTNAATSITCIYFSASADATISFTGGSFLASILWRASFAPSSVPVSPVATTSAAVAGTLQTGLQLNLKGLPVSSQGLLLPGDYFECGLQLNQIASPLDSDAAGLGTAILTRPPRNSPADGTGFVVNNPMGRFLVTSNSTVWNEMPGRMSDASLELVEDISF